MRLVCNQFGLERLSILIDGDLTTNEEQYVQTPYGV
nr:MAG TPA: hypothetical protein [Caudoviricetes sp.]DAT64828.1 MAG TPA: hypothetical protein [Caudoviricetes sp.]